MSNGNASIGAMLTAVNRDNNAFSGDSLRRSAYTGGLDFRREFHNHDYRFAGYVAKSQVAGTPKAIALTQANSTHYFQKPGDGERYDTTRTSLAGDAERLTFEKINGTFQFQESFIRYSPGFEVNDLGFLTAAGEQHQSTWLGLNLVKPTTLYRQLFLNVTQDNQWNSAKISSSDLTDNAVGINVDAELANSWWLHGNMGAHRFLPVYDDRASRGGPAFRRLPYTDASLEVDGDPRMRLRPGLGVYAWTARKALSWGFGVDPSVTYRVSSSFSASLAPHFEHNSDNNQWMDNIIADGGADTAYTFGHIAQNTVSLTARVDYTLTPTLSLQVYAQPFASSGRYSNWRELSNDPRNVNYDARFRPYGTPAGASEYNFDVAEFNSNIVLRWEYRAGSSIYAVWTQGRSYENDGSAFGTFNVHGSARELYAIHPDNTFLIKASYWFSL